MLYYIYVYIILYIYIYNIYGVVWKKITTFFK